MNKVEQIMKENDLGAKPYEVVDAKYVYEKIYKTANLLNQNLIYFNDSINSVLSKYIELKYNNNSKKGKLFKDWTFYIGDLEKNNHMEKAIIIGLMGTDILGKFLMVICMEKVRITEKY